MQLSSDLLSEPLRIILAGIATGLVWGAKVLLVGAYRAIKRLNALEKAAQGGIEANELVHRQLTEKVDELNGRVQQIYDKLVLGKLGEPDRK